MDYLRLKRCLVFKHHSTGFTMKNGEARAFKYGDKGIADIIGCFPNGRFLAVEVKLPGNKPTPEQLEFLDTVHQKNGIGIVATSLEDVMRLFPEDLTQLP
jgi:hypothetical protein